MVARRLTIAFTHPVQVPEAIELFDHEFITTRGRSISLARRFGDVFALPDALVATGRVAGDVVSALLVRPFSWQENTRGSRGAMIGLVCTAALHRGRGYAAELLAATEVQCRALGIDFGVLWALHDNLYVRQGWIRADCGMLGARRTGTAAGTPLSMDEQLVARLHALHERRCGPRMLRVLSNYRHLLPPAEYQWALAEGESFALCGWREHTGYLHDIVARGRDLPRLWHGLAAQFGDLYVNVARGSNAHRWLVENADLEWTPQSLAMWKAFRGSAMPFAEWHVPFLDRI